MFDWIAQNAATIITVVVLLVVIGIALLSLLKDKKHRSGGCTGNCATCGMGCSYGKKNK